MSELRVLVVDDNPGDVLLLKEAFDEAKIPVELLVAENAVQAYAWMRELSESEAPDLILLDLNLPIIKGQAVLRELHDHRPWWKSRTIVLSSSAAKHEISECMMLGATEYVVKPAQFDDYIKLVRHLNEMHQTAVSPPAREPLLSLAAPIVAAQRTRRSSGTSQLRRGK